MVTHKVIVLFWVNQDRWIKSLKIHSVYRCKKFTDYLQEYLSCTVRFFWMTTSDALRSTVQMPSLVFLANLWSQSTLPPTYALPMRIPFRVFRFCSKPDLIFRPVHCARVMWHVFLVSRLSLSLLWQRLRKKWMLSSKHSPSDSHQPKKDYINTLGILIWSLVNGQSDSLNFFGELIPMKVHLYNFYENGKKYFIFQILFCWYQKGILLWNKYFVRSRSKAKQPNSLVKTSDFLFQLTWLAWFSCNIRDTSMTCVTH